MIRSVIARALAGCAAGAAPTPGAEARAPIFDFERAAQSSVPVDFRTDMTGRRCVRPVVEAKHHYLASTT